jgi:hypothetical protein
MFATESPTKGYTLLSTSMGDPSFSASTRGELIAKARCCSDWVHPGSRCSCQSSVVRLEGRFCERVCNVDAVKLSGVINKRRSLLF